MLYYDIVKKENKRQFLGIMEIPEEICEITLKHKTHYPISQEDASFINNAEVLAEACEKFMQLYEEEHDFFEPQFIYKPPNIMQIKIGLKKKPQNETEQDNE